MSTIHLWITGIEVAIALIAPVYWWLRKHRAEKRWMQEEEERHRE